MNHDYLSRVNHVGLFMIPSSLFKRNLSAFMTIKRNYNSFVKDTSPTRPGNSESSTGVALDISNQSLSVWFQLTDHQGNSIGSEKVKLIPSSDIADLRDAVKEMYSGSHLKERASSDLLVYRNKEAFLSDKEVYTL